MNATNSSPASAASGSVHATEVNPLRIREKLGLSQSQFAELLSVSKKTLQNWEQEVRAPSGPALSLLKLVAADPKHAARTLGVKR